MIFGFEIGCRAPLLIRHECVERAHVSPPTEPWRLLYASDLHLTARRERLVADLAAAVRQERPDVVLLGGDLIDRRAGLPALTACVRQLGVVAPVLAVPGNHDARLSLDGVRGATRNGGGHWLPDADFVLTHADRLPLHLHATPRHGQVDALRVLVAHRPEVVDAAAAAGYDLVLAGHLHGGQCVVWQSGQRLYPGAWFSRWNGLRFQVGRATLLVSRGAADTIPVRFRCPREVLSCHVG